MAQAVNITQRLNLHTISQSYRWEQETHTPVYVTSDPRVSVFWTPPVPVPLPMIRYSASGSVSPNCHHGNIMSALFAAPTR